MEVVLFSEYNEQDQREAMMSSRLSDMHQKAPSRMWALLLLSEQSDIKHLLDK